jgi:hypothetical protein
MIRVVFILGELERIFLVLREKVALRRLQLPDPNAGPSGSNPPPTEDADVNIPGRGQKRPTSDERSSPSKRPTL